MTKIKYLQDGWKEHESNIEDYVTNTLMTTINYVQVEQAEERIETIAKAGIAAGADGIFIETHPDPRFALSDGANMLPLNQLEDLLVKLLKIKKALL